MYNFLVVIMIIIAVLLILAVLVQRSKGGGFSSSVNANQFMGVQKGTDFIEKTTWTLAISLFALCLVVSMLVKNQGPAESRSNMDKVDKEAPAPAPAAQPAPAVDPAQTPAPATK
ncbi:MAG: preprotein translocase subunit SecG [Bacteroidetes bacterium]|nr:preprotein translocase subunit SecG [Bacteroidota bacterium]